MRFIIVSTQGAGSVMLGSLLNSHPCLTCYAEESLSFIKQMKDGEGALVKYNVISPELLLTEFCDYKIIHLVRRNLFRLAVSDEINNNKRLYNRPAHIFSTENINDIGICIGEDNPRRHEFIEDHLPNSVGKILEKGISLSVESIKRRIESKEKEIQFWTQSLMGKSMMVFYESLTGDKEIEVLDSNLSDDICDFLEVERCVLTTTLKR